MGLIDRTYIKGIASALHETSIIKVSSLDAVAYLAEQGLSNKFNKVAMDPNALTGTPMVDPAASEGGQPQQASPEELSQVTQSGISEGDIQSAAKVIQVIAEMKQQSDQAAMGGQQPQMAGAAPQPPAAGAQPPLPPAPQPPMQGGQPPQPMG